MKLIEVQYLNQEKKMKKKKPFERTKVVIRHLPPSLSQFHLFSQFDHLFAHRYNWYSFRPGTYSQKHQRYSRAYIDFNSPGDVLEFAEFFDDHNFVNEKGAQFKAKVEYAPSQRLPKSCTLKDSREGTIYKDPDYLEFLKVIAKPVQSLPSAETQLERKEAEQSGFARETLIITTLMEFVRQKRAAEGGKKDSSVAVKGCKRAGSASVDKPRSNSNNQGAEKKKDIPKGSPKNANQKGKSAFLVSPKEEGRPATLGEKQVSDIECVSTVEDCVSRITLTANTEKKRILLLKGKAREISSVPGNSPVSGAPKQSRIFKGSERLIKGILLNNEAQNKQSLTAIQPRHKTQNSNLEHDKFLAGPMNKRVDVYLPSSEQFPHIFGGDVKVTSDESLLTKNRYSLGSTRKIQEECTKNKDRTYCGAQSPFTHSDAHHDNGEKLSSTTLQHTGLLSNSVEGSHKHFGRHVPAHRTDDNSFLIASERKSSKRRGSTGYAVREKQVWVQKSSSGS